MRECHPIPGELLSEDPKVIPSRTVLSSFKPFILVVIANYGETNAAFLSRLLGEFRSMNLRLDLHVLSDHPKNLGADVTVHVGLPTRDPRSLPFGHRALFSEYLNKADFFIYCEDDTLVTEQNIRAFMEVSPMLNPGEIPGFLRVERISPQSCYVECAHGCYRWDPASVVQRGSLTFASFTNMHSAFTMATRAQLQHAIHSGGFVVKPHISRFDVLESAASDLYTQCGMTRLVCLSRLEDFLVAHLPNTNHLKWGQPYEEFIEQTRALERNHQKKGWKGTLMAVETRMPLGAWSKNLYERPDPLTLGMIPAEAKTVLSVGSGWGATEELLASQGRQVTGIPVDAVFGDCLRRRGVETVEGSFDEALGALQGRQFDAVLVQDVLQLLPDPVVWLSRLRPIFGRNAVLLATVPRTFDLLRVVWFFRGLPGFAFPKNFEASGVQRVTRWRLARWFGAAGMRISICRTCNTPKRISIERIMREPGRLLAADRFMVRARPQSGS